MIPRDVLLDGEELYAHDRDGDGEEAEGEDADEEDLLRLAQVEALDGGHGEEEDGDVGDDVAAGVDVDLGFCWHALGRDGLVPHAVEGAADEQRHEDLGEAPHADDDDGDEVDGAHALDAEDAVVGEEEGHFGGEEAGVVEEEGYPESLGRGGGGLVRRVMELGGMGMRYLPVG